MFPMKEFPPIIKGLLFVNAVFAEPAPHLFPYHPHIYLAFPIHCYAKMYSDEIIRHLR